MVDDPSLENTLRDMFPVMCSLSSSRFGLSPRRVELFIEDAKRYAVQTKIAVMRECDALKERDGYTFFDKDELIRQATSVVGNMKFRMDGLRLAYDINVFTPHFGSTSSGALSPLDLYDCLNTLAHELGHAVHEEYRSVSLRERFDRRHFAKVSGSLEVSYRRLRELVSDPNEILRDGMIPEAHAIIAGDKSWDAAIAALTDPKIQHTVTALSTEMELMCGSPQEQAQKRARLEACIEYLRDNALILSIDYPHSEEKIQAIQQRIYPQILAEERQAFTKKKKKWSDSKLAEAESQRKLEIMGFRSAINGAANAMIPLNLAYNRSITSSKIIREGWSCYFADQIMSQILFDRHGLGSQGFHSSDVLSGGGCDPHQFSQCPLIQVHMQYHKDLVTHDDAYGRGYKAFRSLTPKDAMALARM